MATRRYPLDYYFQGIPPDVLDSKVTAIHQANISQAVTNWRHLSPFLGLNKVDDEAISSNHNQNAQVQRRVLLNTWSTKFGSHATYRNLMASFYQAENIELVEKVVQVLGYRINVPAPPHNGIGNNNQNGGRPNRPLPQAVDWKVWLSCGVVISGILIALITIRPFYAAQTSPEGTVSFPETTQGTETVQCHEIKNRKDLHEELAEIGNWEILCDALGVEQATLESLRYNHGDSVTNKRKCLDAFLKQGSACWETVVKVVASYPFYNKRLAKAIELKHGVK